MYKEKLIAFIKENNVEYRWELDENGAFVRYQTDEERKSGAHIKEHLIKSKED